MGDAESGRLQDLTSLLDEYQPRHPDLSLPDRFTLWFVEAYLTGDASKAEAAVSNRSGDGNIDAMVIDDDTRVVSIVQTKWSQVQLRRAEKRNDLHALASLAGQLVAEEGDFNVFAATLEPRVRSAARKARGRIRDRDYALRLYYATLGSAAEDKVRHARRTAKSAAKDCSLEVLDRARVLLAYDDYISGVAPPVPSVVVTPAGQHCYTSTVDERGSIASMVLTLEGPDIAALYSQGGKRIFARNVRGYLDASDFNDSILDTLSNEPERFLHFNNGVTIVCDGIERVGSIGPDAFMLSNPQVINGQQTTRAIHQHPNHGKGAKVLVRVLCVPREVIGGNRGYDALINKIAACMNTQNAVTPVDLRSNERIHVELERQLRCMQYKYLRKRETKKEARADLPTGWRMIKKEELAQAVSACEMDPVRTLEGLRRLFRDHHPRVFRSANALYYLSRYWVMKMVNRTARGWPDRRNTKWVVLHLLWKSIEDLLEGDSRMRAVAVELRKEDNPSDRTARGSLARRFETAAELLFKTTDDFYRAHRGKGRGAKDTFNFFVKTEGLGTEVGKWNRSATRNPRMVAWKREVRALRTRLSSL